MASGGFKPNAATDFLEEWKAKREKMRAKMLGDIAAITSANAISSGAAAVSKPDGRPVQELNAPNGNPERGGGSGASSHAVSRSASSSALTRWGEEEAHAHVHPATAPVHLARGPDPKKAGEKLPDAATAATAATAAAPAGQESDVDSPKGKEKKSSGPSARKGKGQIEKRKLREKRRSTGVVSMPSNESLDELDDDDGEKERKGEEELTQHNTEQNESMTSDYGAPHTLEDAVRPSRHKGEDDVGGNKHRQSHTRHGPTELERRAEELERELALERQENARLVKSLQDKDELIAKLKEEVDLLNRDLDDIEDENEQLKQENKTLLKVVGQLTR